LDWEEIGRFGVEAMVARESPIAARDYGRTDRASEAQWRLWLVGGLWVWEQRMAPQTSFYLIYFSKHNLPNVRWLWAQSISRKH